MKNNLSKTWSQYEAGKEYKRRIGLYERVRVNERYYRGDQWEGAQSDLPRPVFNIIKRMIDYMICTVASGNISISYSDENLPFIRSRSQAEAVKRGMEAMTKNASYRWERCKMDDLVFRLLSDAAISGDGALYCYWDSNAESGQVFAGDIVTATVDSTNIFPANVNSSDIQSQEYIIVSGRESVRSLRHQALDHGVSPDIAASISPDSEVSLGAGDLASYELSGDDEAKTTYLIKFWREDGFVCFEKSTKECVIHRAKTACRLYPIAFFNWHRAKSCFHGASPISNIIPNQNFINRAYAMVMKHMTDTAFSKVIYDKTKIPEWSNKVGEAIGAIGGGNVSDSVSVVGVGQLQSGYTELIEQAVGMTKELSGVTDSALGNVIPQNTSAIVALQEASRLPLQIVRTAFAQCLEDLANIWADMMCAYYPKERLLPFYHEGELLASEVDFPALAHSLIRARIDVGNITNYRDSGSQSILDKLLDGGHITTLQYLEQLPDGALHSRASLIEAIKKQNFSIEEDLTDEY